MIVFKASGLATLDTKFKNLPETYRNQWLKNDYNPRQLAFADPCDFYENGIKNLQCAIAGNPTAPANQVLASLQIANQVGSIMPHCFYKLVRK